MQSGSVLEGDIGDVSGARRPAVVAACLAERDHELRAALFGIEASASGLSQHRDQLTSTQVDELVNGLVAEIRRVRTLVDGAAVPPSTFDLGDAIRRVVACANASGLEIRFFVPPGVEVEGRKESAAQVLVALLDNVRRHAESPVDVRVAVLDDVVDVIEQGGSICVRPRRGGGTTFVLRFKRVSSQ